ncbi:FemAB family XrtA/PEP-CTERM system-associated protein [Iodidimonas sp. SYSU 1G8]|uniref:FemAB family XrtA/PEP-CTERM system-associated protein n=1 Tax=Iodidimonas sp. SYSU 1G8 TaxID=3133967 RepID=UPI0031FEE6BF
MSLIVTRLSADRHEQWDAYVQRAPSATFFHLSGWKVAIENAFGHDCPYLLAESAGEIVGVLPLVRIKSLLFGHMISSSAFAVYGGPVADTPAALRALVEAASALTDSVGADYLELRGRAPTGLGWPAKDQTYATFRRAISADPDANLKAIPRKQRAVVRKAIDRGLTGTVDAGLDRFFLQYATSVRNLGTPVFPRRWFAELLRVFHGSSDILTIEHDGRPVSSVLNFYFRDEVLPYYGGGGREARALGANDFMYYDLMCRAGARGATLFDFGRSKVGSGAFAFKRNFGFEAAPLHYEYYLPQGGPLPDASPNNPKYRLMIQVWSRLPLGVANALGPRVSRYLG